MGRALPPQMPDPEENGKVHHRAGSGENQHGDADGVLMEATRRGVDAAASAVSPMATRRPLMANTAVHKLCNNAIARLTPPMVRTCF
jgi:hypothetical protein